MLMDRESFRTCTVSYRIRREFGGGRREKLDPLFYFLHLIVYTFSR